MGVCLLRPRRLCDEASAPQSWSVGVSALRRRRLGVEASRRLGVSAPQRLSVEAWLSQRSGFGVSSASVSTSLA